MQLYGSNNFYIKEIPESLKKLDMEQEIMEIKRL